MINSVLLRVARLSRPRRPVDPTEDAELANFPADIKVDPGAVPDASRKGDGRVKHEQVVREKLARLARLPVPAIFDLEPTFNFSGLSIEAAAHAFKIHGPNIFATERPATPLALLAVAIANPFNCLLIVLAIISIATGDKATFAVMMCMVVASTGLRFWQDLKSVSQASKLINSVTTRVHVCRQRPDASSVLHPEEIEIDRKEVVPGDVLLFTSGDVFPGDCVVLSAEALSVAQASLTGELMPVDKSPRVDLEQSHVDFDLLDNQNVCLAGTSVVTGNGRAVVVLTGNDTYMATMAKDLAKKKPLNSMQRGIRHVSYLLMVFTLIMAPTVLVIQGLLNKNWKNAAFFAISVAVGLTPEMLPMIVTSNLALSAVRVAREKVIVKQFEAIQNLGAVTILCSDKTGTLTMDMVQLSVSIRSDGIPSELPLKLAYVNSSLQTGTRSLLDAAIVDHARKTVLESGSTVDDHFELDNWRKISEVPFDSSRRLLSVLVSRAEDEKGLLITKGAVEEVLDRCVQVYQERSSSSSPSFAVAGKFKPNDSPPLSADAKRDILETADRLNREGLRLVAVACRSAVAMQSMVLHPEDERDLVFIGFLGFLDPVKPDAAKAVEDLAALGVQVRILTGDAPTVAVTVARTLGILPGLSPVLDSSPDHTSITIEEKVNEEDLIITGSQLASLSDDEAAYHAAIERCLVFAKLSPHQKMDVVQVLQKGGGGRAVAFLGDGVNDALAIRAADVGISVDSGTEIAKEAADVILLEKSLGVICHGVLQGRITFTNTVKYIMMACSSNFGNVFSILAASAWLPYEPMRPLQLLFQNLLYDFSQASIPWDNVDNEYMIVPRPWRIRKILRFMLIMGPTSSIFDICIFCLNWFKWGIRTGDSPLVPRAQTAWFIEGALTQVLVIHVLRTAKIPFFQSTASLPVIIVTSLIAAVALAIPHIPRLSTALGMMPPVAEYYGFLFAILTAYIILVQLVKTMYLRLFHDWL